MKLGRENITLGGRPKEQGGHKTLNISVDKFVAEALAKVDNKSQFIEKVARPVLEQLDPGEASVFLWQIDVYISQQIITATQNQNFNQAQALSWLASQLEDARKLCGIPPSDFNISPVNQLPPDNKESSQPGPTERERIFRTALWALGGKHERKKT